MTKKVLKISITIILIFSLTSCSFFKDFLNRDKSKEIEKSEIAEEIEKSEIADETDENIDINKQRRMNVKPEDVEWEMDTVSQNYLIALNAFFAEKETNIVPIENDPVSLTAQADLPEDKVLEYWLLNGEKQDSQETDYPVEASEMTVIESVQRQNKQVATFGAEMYFLNEKGEPKGDPFSFFDFEKPYQNPVTEEKLDGGKITVHVKAIEPPQPEPPEDKDEEPEKIEYVIDHWLFNGIPYYFSSTVKSFTVTGLDYSLTYEAVWRDKKEPAYPLPEILKVDPDAVEEPEEEITLDIDKVSNTGYFAIVFNGSFKGTDLTQIPLNKTMNLTVKANVPEKKAVDYWLFNGLDLYTEEDTIDIEATEMTIIEPLFRDRKEVKSIQSYMKFFDKDGKLAGTKFDKFDFEDDYKNPNTDEIYKGKYTTVNVEADIPEKKVLSHWKINEVAYSFAVPYFNVYNLDESTIYEAVLADENKDEETTTTTTTTAVPVIEYPTYSIVTPPITNATTTPTTTEKPIYGIITPPDEDYPPPTPAPMPTPTPTTIPPHPTPAPTPAPTPTTTSGETGTTTTEPPWASGTIN